jgi:hypothetical protein
MSYTAAKHYVPLNGSLPGNADEGGLPWEEGSESSPTRHDTWLLSFIDILALLLTLFVLLLAYQDSEMKLADAQKNTVRELSPDSVISLDVWSLLFGQQALTVTDLSTSEGFVMAGESLLPVDMGTVHPAAERAVPVAQPAKEAQVSLVSDEVVGAVEEDELIQAEEETLDVLAQAGSATSGAPHSPTNDVEALLEVFVTGELRDRVEVAVHPGEVKKMPATRRTGSCHQRVRPLLHASSSSKALRPGWCALLDTVQHIRWGIIVPLKVGQETGACLLYYRSM